MKVAQLLLHDGDESGLDTGSTSQADAEWEIIGLRVISVQQGFSLALCCTFTSCMDDKMLLEPLIESEHV